jgi:lysyl endopeptidase
MKNKLIFLFVFVIGTGINLAQTVELGAPKLWSGKLKTPRNFLKMPHIDAEEQLRIDSLNKANGYDKVLRFGYEHHVEINILEQGVQTVTPNGDVYTTYGVSCEDALSINLIFDRFKLSENATLYLSDKEFTQYIGAHTAANNNTDNVLGTELIRSDAIIIQVYEPYNEVGKSELILGTVVHGYRDIDQMMDDFMKNLNSSGACNIDVNCPQGNGWGNQIKSVARIVAGGGLCTGSLVHNTSGNIIPYFLTARHCGTNVGGWTFRFRWEAPQSGVSCATTAPSANGPTNMTINGAALRASNTNADWSLLELNSEPNPNWDIFYNGWDNSDALNVTSSTGIHHPSGDIKKICHSNMATIQQTISFNGDPNTRVWRVPSWTEGVTEQGSSGSPLFNQTGRVIGVLSGGNAACSGTNNNGGYDVYGRFGWAWDALPQNNNQLKHWLDPNNTGVTILDGVNPLEPDFNIDIALTEITGVESVICGNRAWPFITILNNGADDITTLTINYQYNGTNGSLTWNGLLSNGQTAQVQLPDFNLIGGNNQIVVTLSNPNNSTDENPGNNSISSSFLSAADGEYITMDLTLDCFGDEITWEVVDDNGAVWYQGGPYTNSASPQTITAEMCFAEGCYDLIISDSWGDGLNGSADANCNINGEMVLYRNTNNQVLGEINASNVNFGNQITFPFCAESTVSLGELDINTEIKVFPNPTSELTRIDFGKISGEKYIAVYDLTGKLVWNTITEKNEIEFDASHFSAGIFTLNIVADNQSVVKKLVKQ